MRTAPSSISSVLAAVLLAGAVQSAAAEDAALHRALAAGSLHEGPLDMVAYYLPNPDGTLEVTATFAPRDGGAPSRIVLALADRDAVRFGVPGYRGILYGFARAGDLVTLSVTAVPAAGPAPNPLARPADAPAAGAIDRDRRAGAAAQPGAAVTHRLAAGTKQGCAGQPEPRRNPRGGCKAPG